MQNYAGIAPGEEPEHYPERSVANSLWPQSAREIPSPFYQSDTAVAEDRALETILWVFEHEKVAAAMRTLPERWRTVLWHAEVLGEPPGKIAPLLGIEPNDVSTLLVRARAALRTAYELPNLTRSGTNAPDDLTDSVKSTESPDTSSTTSTS